MNYLNIKKQIFKHILSFYSKSISINILINIYISNFFMNSQ